MLDYSYFDYIDLNRTPQVFLREVSRVHFLKSGQLSFEIYSFLSPIEQAY